MMRAIRTMYWLMLMLLMGGSLMTLEAQANEPQAIVSAFLEAWGNQDSDTMHRYLSPISQEAYPKEVFSNRYEVANTALSLTGLTYTIQEVTLQGFSAVVHYDIVIESTTFGTIEDNDRVMRLVQINGQWGIAWSSMDIFAALAGASLLEADGELDPRANIYDRNGHLVAWYGTMVAVYSSRQNMSTEADCQTLISNIGRRSRQAISQTFANYDVITVFFLIELEESLYNAHRDDLLNICGANITRTYETRVYYGGNAMSHVAGYVGQIRAEELPQYVAQGYRRDSLIGQTGIERQYQAQLAGTPRRILRIREPGGTVLHTLGGTVGNPPTSVQMTIDRDLQVATNQAIWDAFVYAEGNWGGIAEGGAAVVLDVNTGEILAMASYPFLDPMLFNPQTRIENPGLIVQQFANDPNGALINHAVQNRYAPGSVYKVVTAVAALNEGLVKPDTNFYCDLFWDGRSKYGDETVSRSDWRAADGLEPAGDVTPAIAISASCNPFFWEYGALLYRERGKKLAVYSQMLGMGKAYNIFGGVIREADADLDNPTRSAIAINNAIGQGNVQVPPIQMGVATATIANDGTVYQPQIVKQVGGFDGTDVMRVFEPEILQQNTYQPDVLETVREGMCGTIGNWDFGTAYHVFYDADTQPNYTACGKTGTAEAGGNPHAWFIAYAPADDPQVAVVVVVSRAGREGSEVAAPITRRILDVYFDSPVASYPLWWNTQPFERLPVPPGGGRG